MSSAPAAAAGSGPGGDGGSGEVEREGQPELGDAAAGESVTVEGGAAGDAGATMEEAAAEEVGAVDGVTVESDLAMTDAGAGGGVGMESGSLYMTESAGMIGEEGDGPAENENMQALNGGVEKEELLEVEADASQGEAEFDRDDQRARYSLPPLDKDGIQVSSLVWSKLRGHPWWPGEIFDPSSASELALKHQKKGHHLVAYSGDTTFAWCEESQLKPFMTHYSEMEKQSSSDAFINSVNHALEELSRRILSGMSCPCLPEELSESGMSYMVENSGLRHGVTCSTVKQAEILEYFNPENLLHYVKSLAQTPGQGGDLLDLVIACSQLTSFYRSKGCPELASFQTSSWYVDNGMDTPLSKNVMLGEASTVEVQPSHDKPKRGRGRPRKRKPEDSLELTDKRSTPYLKGTGTSDGHGEKQDILLYAKTRNINSSVDTETETSPIFYNDSSFKIGDCMRRAASQLTGPSSSSILNPQYEPAVHNRTYVAECGEFDISSDNDVSELPVKKRASKRRIHHSHVVDPKDLLSNLCSVAMEPMNGCSFSKSIISYFCDFRNYAVSVSTEANNIEKVKGETSGSIIDLPSPEVETTDHMQDAYWSGVSLHNDPIDSFRGASANMRPRRRRRSSRRACGPKSNVSSPSQYLQLGMWSPKKQTQVTERPIIHVDEKMVDEMKPTALVLSFGRSSALPSEMDLIRMFSRYGPLKETDTEVHMNSNTVKVVFKKRVDAERAFSVAGKYCSFGHSLISFRLVNLPFSLGKADLNYSKLCPEAIGTDVPAPIESGVPFVSKQIDIDKKTDKAEAKKEPSVEQVQMVKQAGQTEDTIKSNSHTEGANGDSHEALSDTMQIEFAVEAPEDVLVCGDCVTEAYKDTVEVDNVDEVQEEARICQDFQAHALTEELTHQVVAGAVEVDAVAEAP